MEPFVPHVRYLEDIEGRAHRSHSPLSRFAGAAAQVAGVGPREAHNDPWITDYRYHETALLVGATSMRPAEEAAAELEQAVTVHFRLSGDRYGTEAERQAVREPQGRLRSAIDETDANARRNDPSVEGAYTPSTRSPIPPWRTTSRSSIESAPVTMPATKKI